MMKYKIPVKEIMATKPIFTKPNSNSLSAARLMAKHDISFLPVVEDKILIGLITEGDILKRVFIKNKNPKKIKVKEIMTKKPISVSPDDDVSKVAELMNTEKITKMPVTEGGKLLGCLTEKDLLKIEPGIIDVLFERLKLREPSLKITYSRGE